MPPTPPARRRSMRAPGKLEALVDEAKAALDSLSRLLENPVRVRATSRTGAEGGQGRGELATKARKTAEREGPALRDHPGSGLSGAGSDAPGVGRATSSAISRPKRRSGSGKRGPSTTRSACPGSAGGSPRCVPPERTQGRSPGSTPRDGRPGLSLHLARQG